MKTTPQREIIIFIVLLACCSALFWSFSWATGANTSIGRYVESMIVSMLVCYLLRFVFIVVKHI